MKRYLLFAGSNYYPHGGWADFRGSFDEPALAMGNLHEIKPTLIKEVGYGSVEKWEDDVWFHVIDSNVNELVLTNRESDRELIR